MTKAEILERIKELDNAQSKTVDLLSNLIKLPSIGADATLIASVLGTINATIFDTMTTLALILSEMMPEEREKAPEDPPQSKYDPACLKGFPKCQCVTCVHYHRSDENGPGCCMTHRKSCRVNACPDYVKEE